MLTPVVEYRRVIKMILEEYYGGYKIQHTDPKHAIIEQKTEMMEDMTEVQFAEYLAEKYSDY